MECKYCRYYEFDRRIECCHGHGEVQIGICRKSEREHGCLTIATDRGCTVWERRVLKYHSGDVFIGDSRWNVNGEERSERRVFTIIRIMPEYSPLVYRVRDNRNSEYSVTEEWLDEMERILEVEE